MRLLNIIDGVIWRVLSKFFIGLKLKRVDVDGRLVLRGFPLIRGKGKVVFRGRVDLRSRPESTAMGVVTRVVLNALEKDSRIEVDDGVGISGAVLCAKESIRIGKNTNIGSGAVIMDTDFHPITTKDRAKGDRLEYAQSSPVRIGEGCFIGARSMVLKGVCLGDYCVVGAGAVVTKSFPSHSIVAGNPAKVIGNLD